VGAFAGRFRAVGGSKVGFGPSGSDTRSTEEDATSSDGANSVLTESSCSTPRVPSGTASQKQLPKLAFGPARQRTRQLEDLDRSARIPASAHVRNRPETW
jgi:hypothetical protein